MPPAPKLSQVKKAGSSKTKGAVRAKTGCYTCRIRRKKCDEEKTDRDTCKTCERLRLECLGFGAKRPEWLRENRNVVMLRDRIKVFLASQGLIKGHSGTGSRPNEQGHAILRLSSDQHPNYHSSSSESPPSPSRTLSLSSDDERHRLATSSVRDDQREGPEPAWFDPGAHFVQSGLHARSDSPFSNNGAYDDGSLCHHPPYALSNSTSSIVDSSHLSPALRSGFSRLYTDPIIDVSLFEGLDFPGAMPSFESREPLYQLPSTFLPEGLCDLSIQTYVKRIADIQYLLGDPDTLPTMIWESYSNHRISQTALKLLTSVYYKRQQHPSQAALGDFEMNNKLHKLLEELQKGNLDDPDNAIAALHGVSMFLFDGGQGAWASFLQLASGYVNRVLSNSTYGNAKDALLYATPKDAFIVKTAIWFDVLASITTQNPPHFIEEIRAMFKPTHHGIYDPSFDTSPQCSMMSPMGCENRVVWALAETSYLSYWKKNEDAKGRLSVADLVSRAQEIEHFLYQKPFDTNMDAEEDREIATMRYLASEIFRGATRLFLTAVVNGDRPQVRQIQQEIEDIMVSFHRLLKSGIDCFKVSRSVVRSTVFGIYITGSLTTNLEHRQHLVDHLNRESSGVNGEGVGNCASIRKMLEEVWKAVPSPTQPIPWRTILKDRQILLV